MQTRHAVGACAGLLVAFGCATAENLGATDGGGYWFDGGFPDGNFGNGGTGASATGGYVGTGGYAGAGGWGGAGGTAGGTAGSGAVSPVDGGTGDGSTAGCPPGQKVCGGLCVEPNPGIGCGLTGCDSCGAPPENSFRKCTNMVCDFECYDGFRLTQNMMACEADPSAGGSGGGGGTGGMGGSGGSSGSGGTGGTGGRGGGGMGGSGGTGGTGGTGGVGGSGGGSTGPRCVNGNADSCPVCAGPKCCKSDGSCGCETFWIPVCS